MEIMVVFSKHKESRDSKKVQKLVMKNIANPLINVSEEIEIFLQSNEKVYIDRLKKIAEENGYDMEVIK